jgi:hypothetical protein
MTAATFLNAMRRIFARRGIPAVIISDNAPQMKLTNRAFIVVWNKDDDDKNGQFFAQKGITWRFVPQHSPWYGGAYESLVGVVKRTLKPTLGRRILPYGDFMTVIIEIEGVLNGRPLTYQHSDLNEREVLRPIDFINPDSSIITPIVDDPKGDRADPNYEAEKTDLRHNY